MDTNLKLSQFLDTINQSADTRIEEEKEATKFEAKTILQQSEEASIAAANQQIAEAKTLIVSKYRNRLSQTSYQCRTAMLQRRQALLQKLFSELQVRLNEFVASPAYIDWMKALLQRLQPAPHSTIYLRSSDLQHKEEFQAVCHNECLFLADSYIQIGGCAILSTAGHTLDNHTLDEALLSQIRNFHKDFHLDGGVFVCHKQ